jgi:hypothetical protein
VYDGISAADEALQRADLVFLAATEGILSMAREVRAAYPDAKIIVFDHDPVLVTTLALIHLNLAGLISEDLANPSSQTRVGRILAKIVRGL